jgi:hypothetical protein
MVPKSMEGITKYGNCSTLRVASHLKPSGSLKEGPARFGTKKKGF